MSLTCRQLHQIMCSSPHSLLLCVERSHKRWFPSELLQPAVSGHCWACLRRLKSEFGGGSLSTQGVSNPPISAKNYHVYPQGRIITINLDTSWGRIITTRCASKPTFDKRCPLDQFWKNVHSSGTAVHIYSGGRCCIFATRQFWCLS